MRKFPMSLQVVRRIYDLEAYNNGTNSTAEQHAHRLHRDSDGRLSWTREQALRLAASPDLLPRYQRADTRKHQWRGPAPPSRARCHAYPRRPALRAARGASLHRPAIAACPCRITTARHGTSACQRRGARVTP